MTSRGPPTRSPHRKPRTGITTASLLLVIDESPASRRAVAYVGRMVGRRRGVRLCLAHLLPRLPPRLLEFRGAENPGEETRLDARLKTRQRRWIATAKNTAQRTLAAAKSTLCKAGVPARALGVRLSEAVDQHRVSDRILELARASHCDTVVVGRASVSWFRALLSGDLSEELIRRGQGFTIWVVE